MKTIQPFSSLGVCNCGAYGGGAHTVSALCQKPMSSADASTVHLRDEALNSALAALVSAAVRSHLLQHIGATMQAVYDGITVTIERKALEPSGNRLAGPSGGPYVDG
jgi:hypothetical protein